MACHRAISWGNCCRRYRQVEGDGLVMAKWEEIIRHHHAGGPDVRKGEAGSPYSLIHPGVRFASVGESTRL
jgi:hypothetical protein